MLLSLLYLVIRIAAQAAGSRWPGRGPPRIDPNVRPMGFTGRPMKQFLFVSPKGVAKETSLRNWVAEALEFVKTLPPKKKKR